MLTVDQMGVWMAIVTVVILVGTVIAFRIFSRWAASENEKSRMHRESLKLAKKKDSDS